MIKMIVVLVESYYKKGKANCCQYYAQARNKTLWLNCFPFYTRQMRSEVQLTRATAVAVNSDCSRPCDLTLTSLSAKFADSVLN